MERLIQEGGHGENELCCMASEMPITIVDKRSNFQTEITASVLTLDESMAILPWSYFLETSRVRT